MASHAKTWQEEIAVVYWGVVWQAVAQDCGAGVNYGQMSKHPGQKAYNVEGGHEHKQRGRS